MPVAPLTTKAKRFAIPGVFVVANVCVFIPLRFKAFLIRKFKLKEKEQDIVGSAAHAHLKLLIRII
jgi:hypothetical protein